MKCILIKMEEFIMFCPKCGTQVPDGAQFCTNCGAKLNDSSFAERVNNSFESFSDATAEQVKNVYNDVKSGIEGTPNAGKLETNRSLAIYILLSLITCGIYGLFFIYSIARDVNTACEGDGQKTRGLVQYILLSIITCGIYPLIWEYSIGNRLAENARKYGMTFQENGTTILMWQLFGAMLCGIGPFIAMHILIKNTNRICDAYNQAHGLY